MKVLTQTTENSAQVAVPSLGYSDVAPIVVLVGGALVALLLTAMIRRKVSANVWATYTAVVAGVAIGFAVSLWNQVAADSAQLAFQGALIVDGIGLYGAITIAVAVIASAIVSASYLNREQLARAEMFVLMLLAAAGGVLMVMANELILVFIGLEVLSISLYVLAGFHRRRASSGEAAMKYLLLGGLASAVFLYGVALVYGGSGATTLTEIRALLNAGDDPSQTLVVGMILLMAGLCFKVAAVPFHSWAPDVYQGAPTPITGFMAAAAKTAGFIVFLRIFSYTFFPLADDWRPVLAVIAALSLFVGAFLGAVQSDVKRMLAYSSIAHAGFIMLGVVADSQAGSEAALTYLFCYSIIILGTFTVVGVISAVGDGNHDISAYKGLSKREPVLAFVLTILLLAQAGIPPSAGFVAKFTVVGATVDNGHWWLALVALLTAVVSAYIYLRIVRAMFSVTDEVEESDKVVTPLGAKLVFGVCALATVAIGLVPGLVLDYAYAASLIS